jgi:uncharacterized protein (TIGR02453 family)
MTVPFRAFDRSLLEFLGKLEGNNNRDWFAQNKDGYEHDVLDPCLAFISAMAEPLEEIAPHFRAVPKRSGGSLMRVYRDTRFARDKRPYKTNVGIQFRHELGKDVHAPGYYFHIDPREVFLGVGTWKPAPRALAAIRDHIVEKPDEWLACRDEKTFAGAFALAGESLVRPPRGFDADHPAIDDLKRKSFLGIHYLEDDDLFDDDIVDTVAGAYRAATPYMRFLCKAIGVPF